MPDHYLRQLCDSEICEACEHPKKRGHSFCGRCYRMLPLETRRNLYRRYGEGYEAAYDTALKWLKDKKINANL